MISKKTELAGRFAIVNPNIEINLFDPRRYSLLGGATHYINGHRIKAQLFGGIEKAQEINSRSFLSLMFQVEFGI